MLMKSALMGLAGLAVIVEASVVPFMPPSGQLISRQFRGGRGGGQNGGGQQNGGQQNGGNNNNNNGGQGQGGNCLNPAVIQSASAQTGQNGGQIEPGQVESKTDQFNFINACQGKTITNGEQKRGGSCNSIIMGEIPAVERMVSTVILNPKNGDNLPAGQSFNIQVRIANMQLGSFTNAQTTYYSAPQALQGGQIVGHTHVTVQNLGGNLNPTNPLNAQQFVFFKGINDDGNGAGTLETPVDGGLPAGFYRLCTMAGASNHQPVLMPVAQRGAQDDCVRFTVGGGNNNNGGGQNGGGQNNGGQNGGGQNNGGQNGGGQRNGGQNGGGQRNNQRNAQAGGGGGANAQNIGGAPPAIENSGDQARPFRVQGDNFTDRGEAKKRACAIQNNACSDAVNRGQAQGKTLQDCTAQEAACNAQA